MKKINSPLGWILLFLGLIIIAITLFFTYQIFTGQKIPPQLFKIKEKKPVPLQKKVPKTQEELQEIIKEQIGQKISEILPPETISQALNLASFSILASIFIWGGSQIASLGIKLIK